jgi:hypothetical protein
MDRNAYRDDNDTGQPDAYWRRRVITLCAGLTLLGLLAWAFSGGGKPASSAHKGAQANGVLPAAAYSGAPTSPFPGADASPSAVPGEPGPADGTAGGVVSPGASGASSAAGSAASLPFPTASHSASGRANAARVGHPTAAPGGTEPGGGCAPGSVVLSLFTSRTRYHAGQNPVFSVYAVSTASRACSFDVSPAKLHVLVMSAGRVIWDSADCARSQPNRVAELSRGVPVQGAITWNRTISLPGCVTVAPARSGRYQVQVRDGSVASPVRSFKLGR